MQRTWTPGFVAAAFLAGCAGSSPSLPARPVVNSVVPAAAPNTKFSIRIPAPPNATARARRPSYISYSTKSLQINLDPGTGSARSQSFDLTTQSGNCAPSGVLGVLTCTLALNISTGSHTANIIAYDQTGGTAGGGKALSATYAFPLTIVAGAANTVTFTLGGITSSFVIVALDTTAVKGDGVTTPFSFTSAAATQFLVEALDADKNPIIGPASPTLTATSTNPTALTVSQNTSNPYQFQIQPTGASATSIAVTFSAPDMTGQGKPATTFAATFAPTFWPQITCASVTCINAGLGADSVSVTESGYSGGFTFTNSAPAKCSIVFSTATTAVITSAPSLNNACTITARDTSLRNIGIGLSFPSKLTQSVDGVSYGTGPATLSFACHSTCTGTTTWQVTSSNPSPAYAWVPSSFVMTQSGGQIGDSCQSYIGGLYLQLASITWGAALMPPSSNPPYSPSLFPVYGPATRSDYGTCRATLVDGFGGSLTVYYSVTVS
jgi:hypothetical protein